MGTEMTSRRAAILTAVAALSALTGCANVKPWQHDVLARSGMQIDADPLISGADGHIYFSREASKGGSAFGGGGCGCN